MIPPSLRGPEEWSVTSGEEVTRLLDIAHSRAQKHKALVILSRPDERAAEQSSPDAHHGFRRERARGGDVERARREEAAEEGEVPGEKLALRGSLHRRAHAQESPGEHQFGDCGDPEDHPSAQGVERGELKRGGAEGGHRGDGSGGRANPDGTRGTGRGRRNRATILRDEEDTTNGERRG